MTQLIKDLFASLNLYQWVMLSIVVTGGFSFLVTFVSQAQAHGRQIVSLKKSNQATAMQIIKTHKEDMLRILRLQREDGLRSAKIRKADRARSTRLRRQDRKQMRQSIDNNTDRILKAVKASQW